MPPLEKKDLPEVKICKYLQGPDPDSEEEDESKQEEKIDYNCLVSADLDGYLNFYAVYPSPIKNTCLARVRHFNKDEQIQRKVEATEE